MKLFNLLFLLAALLMISCGGDDDFDPDNLILGNWTATELVVSGETVAEFFGEEIKTSFNVTGTSMDYNLTLEETSYNVNGGYTLVASFDVNGMESSSTIPYQDIEGNGTYRVEGDTLISNGALFNIEVNGQTVNEVQGEAKAFIETLTETQMVITQDIETISNQSGFETTNITSTRSVWTRK